MGGFLSGIVAKRLDCTFSIFLLRVEVVEILLYVGQPTLVTGPLLGDDCVPLGDGVYVAHFPQQDF